MYILIKVIFSKAIKYLFSSLLNSYIANYMQAIKKNFILLSFSSIFFWVSEKFESFLKFGI